MAEILLIGEYSAESPPHRATEAAVRHAAASLQLSPTVRWISTTDVTPDLVRKASGLWIAPGSPYRDMQGALTAIRVAREEGIPCLGTCGGFQHMIIEYARNVLALHDASHEEYDPYASRLFVSRLACSLVGRSLPLRFTAGSNVASIYNSAEATESYYCNFGVNPNLVEVFRQGPLRITGSDPEGEVRVVELPEHPFFIGTLFLPQTRSTESCPHPLVCEFVRQACRFLPMERSIMTRSRLLISLLVLSLGLTIVFIMSSFVTYAPPISSAEMQNIYLNRITRFGVASVVLQWLCLVLAAWPRPSSATSTPSQPLGSNENDDGPACGGPF